MRYSWPLGVAGRVGINKALMLFLQHLVYGWVKSAGQAKLATFINCSYTKGEIDGQRLPNVDCPDKGDLERGLFFMFSILLRYIDPSHGRVCTHAHRDLHKGTFE